LGRSNGRRWRFVRCVDAFSHTATFSVHADVTGLDRLKAQVAQILPAANPQRDRYSFQA